MSSVKLSLGPRRFSKALVGALFDWSSVLVLGAGAWGDEERVARLVNVARMPDTLRIDDGLAGQEFHDQPPIGQILYHVHSARQEYYHARRRPGAVPKSVQVWVWGVMQTSRPSAPSAAKRREYSSRYS